MCSPDNNLTRSSKRTLTQCKNQDCGPRTRVDCLSHQEADCAFPGPCPETETTTAAVARQPGERLAVEKRPGRVALQSPTPGCNWNTPISQRLNIDAQITGNHERHCHFLSTVLYPFNPFLLISSNQHHRSCVICLIF